MLPPNTPTSTAATIETADCLPPTTAQLGRSFQVPKLIDSKAGRQSFDIGWGHNRSSLNKQDSALYTSGRPSLDCKTGRRSVDIYKLAQQARGSQGGGRSRSSSRSGCHATDLESLSHMLNLITKGRPLDVVLKELQEKKAIYHGLNSKTTSVLHHKTSASWSQRAVSHISSSNTEVPPLARHSFEPSPVPQV